MTVAAAIGIGTLILTAIGVGLRAYALLGSKLTAEERAKLEATADLAVLYTEELAQSTHMTSDEKLRRAVEIMLNSAPEIAGMNATKQVLAAIQRTIRSDERKSGATSRGYTADLDAIGGTD